MVLRCTMKNRRASARLCLNEKEGSCMSEVRGLRLFLSVLQSEALLVKLKIDS